MNKMDNISKAYANIIKEQATSRLDFLKELALLLRQYQCSISINYDKPEPALIAFIGETDSEGIELPQNVDEASVRELIKKISPAAAADEPSPFLF